MSSVGGGTWYAQALDTLAGRDAKPEERPEPGVSLDEVASPRAQRNLERVAGSLGVDPRQLLARLVAGEDARSLLSRAGDAGYGTSIAKSTTGGLAIDQYA